MISASTPRVLIVDDEQFIRDLLSDFFTKSEYEIVTAHDGDAGIAACRAGRFDAALVDLKMPDQTGTDVLAELRSIDPTLPVIIMTGYPTIDASIEAIRRGAQDFVVKPFRLQDLKERVDRAIRSRSIAREIDELRERMASVEEELREYRARQTISG